MNILDTTSNSLGVNPDSLDALMIARYQSAAERYIKNEYPNKSYQVKNIKIVKRGNYALIESPRIEFLNKFDTLAKELDTTIIESERYNNTTDSKITETLTLKTMSTTTTTTTLLSGYEFSINGSSEIKGNVSFGFKFLAEAKAEAKVNIGANWKHNSSSSRTITDTESTEKTRQLVIEIPPNSSRDVVVKKTETYSVKKVILEINLKEIEDTEENYYHLTADIVSNKSGRIVEQVENFWPLRYLGQKNGASYLVPHNITEFQGGISLKQELELGLQVSKYTTDITTPINLGGYECDEYESQIDNEHYVFINETDTLMKVEQEYFNDVPLDNYIIIEIPQSILE